MPIFGNSRPPMMNRPMMNRPQAPMNRPMAPMNMPPPPMMGGARGNMPQGIAAILAGMAAKNPQSQMPPVGLGQAMGSQLPEPQVPGSQPVRQDLSSMLTPEHLEQLRQLGSQGPMGQAQQVPMGMPFQAGATFDPSLSYNPMQTATPIGLGQAMGGQMGLKAYNPMQTATPSGLGQQPQMNMLSNLSQMFNSMGQQQPLQQGNQGGTPLQNGASPLQQSAQPVMNMGVM